MSKTWIALVFLLLSFLVHQSVVAGIPYQRTEKGVIVYADSVLTGIGGAVKLELLSDKIVRVVSVPARQFSADQSLITVAQEQSFRDWQLEENETQLIIKTRSLKVVVEAGTGAVSFYDPAGALLVTEKKAGGRTFERVVHEGQASWKLTQHFQGQSGEAWYGLGQHQDGVYNYRGRQVYFFQNNTEVAIPFLVSTNQYGILWDNYSLTTAGDIRPFRPLSALQLADEKGEKGWLTASYYTTADATTPVLIRAESAINMEYLGESVQQLPAEFKPLSGKVVWTGSISSGFSGIHQLRLTYGGSIRLWIDGKKILDRWRKAWNPAPALLDMPMMKGKAVSIQLEWIPEGAESYCSFKWQEPAPPEQQHQFSFSSEAGSQADYYFIHGATMDEIIAGYRTVTGKAPIVPKWALGFWQSRERYKTQEELLDVVKEFRKRRIPLDNIVLDWSYWKEDKWGSQEFDEKRFPSPEMMIRQLHNQYHTRIMISVWPKFYEGIEAYKNFDKQGWLYPRNVADRQRDWIGKGYVSTFYDAFNEAARTGFWKLIHEKIYSKGFDAWWMDASEPDILSNVSPEKRKLQMSGTQPGPAAAWLNAYPLQNAKGIYEGQRSVDSNKRVFLLTRSGFAGSQRYGATIWSGDIGSTWWDMKAQIAAGMNFSLSGIPYWTMDIGGFVVPRKFEQPNAEDLEEWRELQTRWFQFGAFVPLFRAHGQYPFRELYHIAPETHPAYKTMETYIRLRYRLLPYIYTMAGKAYHENYTIMRGLVMDFPKDSLVYDIADQYLFGPSLLINPVTTYQQRTRKLYLPAGQGWYDFYTGQYQPGGQTIEATAPYEQMPIYVREGTILPMGPALQYTDEKKADTLTLFVYRGKDAVFELYEDEGLNYNYEKGLYAKIPISYNERTGTLTIGKRSGEFPGMLKKRSFRIVPVQPGNAIGYTPPAGNYRIRSYEGKTVTIQL